MTATTFSPLTPDPLSLSYRLLSAPLSLFLSLPLASLFDLPPTSSRLSFYYHPPLLLSLSLRPSPIYPWEREEAHIHASARESGTTTLWLLYRHLYYIRRRAGLSFDKLTLLRLHLLLLLPFRVLVFTLFFCTRNIFGALIGSLRFLSVFRIKLRLVPRRFDAGKRERERDSGCQLAWPFLFFQRPPILFRFLLWYNTRIISPGRTGRLNRHSVSFSLLRYAALVAISFAIWLSRLPVLFIWVLCDS